MNSFPKWTDWSHPIVPGMPVFGADWHREVTFEQLGSIASVGRRTSQVHIGTHSGTHMDAPAHFIEGGATIDQIEPWRFHGEIQVVNLTAIGPGVKVEPHHLEGAMQDFAPSMSALCFVFGWSARFGSSEYFTEQPFFSQATAEIIAASEPRLVAYDVAMPDNPAEGRGSVPDSPIHKIFLGRGIPLVENLRVSNPTPNLYTYSAVPLALHQLDGSPVRFMVHE